MSVLVRELPASVSDALHHKLPRLNRTSVHSSQTRTWAAALEQPHKHRASQQGPILEPNSSESSVMKQGGSKTIYSLFLKGPLHSSSSIRVFAQTSVLSDLGAALKWIGSGVILKVPSLSVNGLVYDCWHLKLLWYADRKGMGGGTISFISAQPQPWGRSGWKKERERAEITPHSFLLWFSPQLRFFLNRFDFYREIEQLESGMRNLSCNVYQRVIIF